jgi:hypothetical protein
MRRALRYLAIVIGIAAIGAIYLAIRWDFIRRHPADRVAEQDAVYEAVLRESSLEGAQLVFEENVRTGVIGGTSRAQCLEQMKISLEPRQTDKPMYDTFFDRLYRLATNNPYDNIVKQETRDDFVDKFCTPGPMSRALSQKFTVAFVDGNKYEVDGSVIDTNLKKLKTQYPGANGIHQFSRVGFDSRLREAIVVTDFNCGMLCGGGRYLVLKKSGGQWHAVGSLESWVY